MTLIITTAGAVLTTLLGVLVGSGLSSRAQRRYWSRDRQADACAQVLRESSSIVIELNRLYYQPAQPAPDGARVPTPIDWKPWNEALAMIALVADHDIVEAAQAIDAQIWPVHQQIKRGWSPDGGWFSLRDALETRRQDFVNIARKHLAAPSTGVLILVTCPIRPLVHKSRILWDFLQLLRVVPIIFCADDERRYAPGWSLGAMV